jgi:hypothetical protein
MLTTYAIYAGWLFLKNYCRRMLIWRPRNEEFFHRLNGNIPGENLTLPCLTCNLIRELWMDKGKTTHILPRNFLKNSSLEF